MQLCSKILNPEEGGARKEERRRKRTSFHSLQWTLEAEAPALSENQSVRTNRIRFTKLLSLVWDSAYSLRICPILRIQIPVNLTNQLQRYALFCLGPWKKSF